MWDFSLSRYSVRVAVEFSRQKASSNARSGGGEKTFFSARSVWLPVVPPNWVASVVEKEACKAVPRVSLQVLGQQQREVVE